MTDENLFDRIKKKQNDLLSRLDDKIGKIEEKMEKLEDKYSLKDEEPGTGQSVFDRPLVTDTVPETFKKASPLPGPNVLKSGFRLGALEAVAVDEDKILDVTDDLFEFAPDRINQIAALVMNRISRPH